MSPRKYNVLDRPNRGGVWLDPNLFHSVTMSITNFSVKKNKGSWKL